jgi:hypothetical protein
MHIGFLLCGIHQSPMHDHIFIQSLALGIFERCACPQMRTLKDFSLLTLHIERLNPMQWGASNSGLRTVMLRQQAYTPECFI